jgi:hypothetical protein
VGEYHKKTQGGGCCWSVCKCGGRTVGARYYNLTDSQDKRRGGGKVYVPPGENEKESKDFYFIFKE